MYRIRTIWTGPVGTPYLSTHYFNEGAGTAQQAADAVAAFWGAVDNFVNSACVWRVDNAVYTVNSGSGLATGISTVVGGTGTGSGAGDMLPLASQGVVQWRTGTFVGGREIRGRTFIPGISETYSVNAPTSTVIAGVNTAAANLIADANSILDIYSKVGHTETAVAAGTMWNQFAVLRSRRD